MNGTFAAASASICATVLPPLMLVRSASVTCVGIFRLRLRIMFDERSAIAYLQSRVVRNLLGDGRVGAALVLMRRMYPERRIEAQHALEQAMIEILGIATGQVGAAGGADQQRIAGEYPIFHLQADRIARVTRCVQHAQAQLADSQHLTIVQRQAHERRRAGPVHGDRQPQLLGQLLRGREMIRVRVGVDQVADAQTFTRG